MLVQAASRPLSDDAIYDMVRRRLANDPVVKGGALQIEVKDGTVTLRGDVELAKQKEKAEKVARKVSGVKQVINELRVTRR
jgi:osmotically-inducible protein OsmY